MFVCVCVFIIANTAHDCNCATACRAGARVLYWRQKAKGGGRRARVCDEKSDRREPQAPHAPAQSDGHHRDRPVHGTPEINRRTFYRHFTDKYQLVTWIYENGFQKAIGDDEPGLFDLFGRVCTYLYADRAFYARALTFTGQNSFRDFLCGRRIHICRRIFPTFFPIRRPRRSCPGRCRTSSSTSCKNWLEQPDCPPPEEFAPWALNLWRSIMGRWKDLGDAWEHTLDHKNA